MKFNLFIILGNNEIVKLIRTRNFEKEGDALS